ncbi:uncharacterized protein LOC133785288 [Humulus lupulus]|uniref:uncharacterized protein LOC133785288 n=1 Tax=Humulus lupulus TaxID=3486 RepID=UPI002B4033E7|nr:uncharacterized protein LOC133785288 [Humulus lupulus]
MAKIIALLGPSPRASVNMENHNQSCTAVPQTAPGPNVCMGGPSQNETFFPQKNLRHDDGYEYEPYVNDDLVANFGDNDERVEGCSSSDDNSEDRLSMLPVEQVDNLNKNPGTLTIFVTEEDRFKYCVFSLEISRRGFRTHRPVLCVDDTFLKTKYGEQILYAVPLDANNHLYPVAFGIMDSENHDSWKYFMSNLKEAIGEVEDLVFVSDRHASITHALETIFPDAYHGACYHHISMNVVAEFKTGHCHVLMYNAAYAFRKSEFHSHFEKIKSKDLVIAQYLEGMCFDKWSRAYFPGNRYNIMIINYAESFNNKTQDARSFPITTFVEFIRFTLQSWFCDRRENSEKTTTTLPPTYEKDLVDMVEKAQFLTPYAIGRHEFHVLDGELNGEWIVPHDIMTIKVRTLTQKNLVGSPKKKQGRPKKKRHPSNAEKVVVGHKCSICGGLGHNRATCKV